VGGVYGELAKATVSQRDNENQKRKKKREKGLDSARRHTISLSERGTCKLKRGGHLVQVLTESQGKFWGKTPMGRGKYFKIHSPANQAKVTGSRS